MAMFPLQKYIPENVTYEPEGTPMERVKKIFVRREYEPISKELQHIYSLTCASTIVGIIVGGTLHIRGNVEKFIENNQATQFYTQKEAKKELHTSVLKQFARGAYKFGWRTTLFTAIFTSIQTLLTAYYGKPSVVHYMAGAGTAGFLFKMSLGLKGSIVGLLIGASLGGIAGFLHLSILKMSGLDLDDLQTIGQQWVLLRERTYKEAVNKNLETEVKKLEALYSINQNMKEKLSLKQKEAEEEEAKK